VEERNGSYKKLGKMESELQKRTHGYCSKPIFAGAV
jgi:hypothetical protein